MSIEEKNNHEAVAEAIASARIEGYEIDSQTESLCVMLAEGLITLGDYIGQVLKMSESIDT